MGAATDTTYSSRPMGDGQAKDHEGGVMSEQQRVCVNCHQAAGVHHVTVRVDVFGPEKNQTKLAQFWLCEGCAQTLGAFFRRDEGLAVRVARALCAVIGRS
jgi:hypothetical protein